MADLKKNEIIIIITFSTKLQYDEFPSVWFSSRNLAKKFKAVLWQQSWENKIDTIVDKSNVTPNRIINRSYQSLLTNKGVVPLYKIDLCTYETGFLVWCCRGTRALTQSWSHLLISEVLGGWATHGGDTEPLASRSLLWIWPELMPAESRNSLMPA